MLTYDNLVAALTGAWTSSGFHEHDVIETVQPGSHEQTYKVELFPNNTENFEEDSIPPWIEVQFNWSPLHQLRAEGHPIDMTNDPLILTWLYNVVVPKTTREQTDQELVRLFQRAIQAALRTLFPDEDITMTPIAIEIRRVYHSDGRNLDMEYVQLVSPNITDLTDEWNNQDLRNVRHVLQSEFSFANAIIEAMMSVFHPPTGKHGTYRSVDTA